MRKLDNPSASRNCQPILNVLKNVLSKEKPLRLLEISSGTGQHSAYFSNEFPNITFQPSEYDTTDFESITAYAKDCKNQNVLKPIFIDISRDYKTWENKFDEESFDYMLNINMIHITPWRCTEGLFKNASHLLKKNGLLITYGPYAVNGILTPESNVNFNLSLKSRDPEWGVRDIRDLKELGNKYGIVFKDSTDMPANNKTLIWQKI
ncbi:UPF0585 protein CG18661 [Condylostylus longicornis]|uniref:UPF0585 protein CG18661 n=1 Tax=Condylostylus longicornis TaxID=2530218 RepID=UPI00244E390B|nr:UPF0585 protein CG18661 [Condylostylus longicornis]